MPLAKYIFMNGEIVPWEQATIHVFSPAAKYGAGVFEGIRGYWNDEQEQLYVFRLDEHLERLHYSQTMMRFDDIVEPHYLSEHLIELLRANAFREHVHIRPIIFIDGHGESAARGPIGTSIVAVPRGTPERVKNGCSVQVSSWLRISDRAMPARVKANANYQNSRFAAIQASEDGYDTALMLNHRGFVAEGPGMCFFMVRDGVPVTPTVTNDILESITRTTILTLLRDRLGREPVERDIDRSELYAAEEAFFCGTGWEITPITSVDRATVGDGKPGALTRELQQIYFDVVHGRSPDYSDWCTAVY